jgi:hypothetical protein
MGDKVIACPSSSNKVGLVGMQGLIRTLPPLDFMVWIGQYIRRGETMMVVILVVHCVSGGIRPAQAAYSLAVYLKHMSNLSV